MSKSKGNILDPIDIIDGISLEALVAKRTKGLMQPKMAKAIEQNTRKLFPNGIASFGTDALRFTFYSLATTGRHIRFELARVEGYRNFCNKLWNASRYVLMNVEGKTIEAKNFTIADKWIFSRWQKVKSHVIEHIEKYRFDLVAQDIYEFVWNEYCDWYLELSKPILYDQTSDNSGTRYTLITILEEILRVAHPLMPFITEEIWQLVAPLTEQSCKTLIAHSFPLPDPHYVNDRAERTVSWIQAFILSVRNIRGEMNVAPGKLLPVLLLPANADKASTDKTNRELVDNYATFLKTLAKLESITWLDANAQLPPAATALVGDLKIFIPLQGIIDVTAETARLSREIVKITKDLEKASIKLDNPNYIAKAPAEVVAKERQLVESLTGSLDKLNESLLTIQKSG